MPTRDLTAATFEQTVSDNDIVLVDFWAEWCGPCKMFGPIFDEASTKHTDVVFGKVDTEAEQQLAAQANIRSIPMLMAFREGVLVFSQAGALPGHVLEDLITQIKGLDMAEVHRQVAEETGTG
jgi:thioredoxin 1